MPIYEYECTACGERFDKLIRSMSQAPPEIVCPACQSLDVQRLISAPTIRAGGEGVGETDTVDSGESLSSHPPILGRKELKAAQEKKRQLREQAKYGE